MRFSCALTFNYGDATRDQKLKMMEIGELLANLLFVDKQIGISERGQTYLTFYVWNESTGSLKIKFLNNSRLNLGIKMMFSLIISDWSATDGHSKREVLEIFNMN